MTATYYNDRESEIAVQDEAAAYGVTPGALVGGDFFKHTSGHEGFQPELEQMPRDRDKDNNQGSVLLTQTGRKRTKVSVEADVIPSGNSSTPTEPDTDLLWKAALRSKFKATAHTTTAAGSTGVTLNLTAGGGAASGIRAGGGDLIAVDIDGAGTYEVRRVVSRATDVVTIDRAFTSSPAAARAVKVGTTYNLSSTAFVSLYFWLYNQNVLRYAVPGSILNDLSVDINHADGVPLLKAKWAGVGKYEITQATSRPTPVTAGVPLAGSLGSVWLGANKYQIITGSFAVKNGLALRELEIGSLEPTGVKFTGNSTGRFDVSMALEMCMTTGSAGEDTQALYDGAKTLTVRDAMCQIGTVPGNIFAWCCPKWQPGPAERGAQDGEVSVKLSGRAYGTIGDDDIFVAFL